MTRGSQEALFPEDEFQRLKRTFIVFTFGEVNQMIGEIGAHGLNEN
jgi:hypothetical protein